MSDIELACHLGAWAAEGTVNALDDIEQAGYQGVEMTPEVVEQFEDRIGVFTEILTQHKLRLMAISSGGQLWPGTNLDEEVERSLNIARFIKACGASVLNLYPPRINPEEPVEDELDLVPVATAYGEIARRTLEVGVQAVLHADTGTYADNPKSIQRFLSLADPEALKLCVDSGFLAEAGISPATFIKENKKRIGLVHLRDLKMKEVRPRKTHASKKAKAPTHTHTSHPIAVELGKGDLKLENFVNALLDCDYSGWAVVEFDHYKDRPLGAIARGSYKYVEQNLDFVL